MSEEREGLSPAGRRASIESLGVWAVPALAMLVVGLYRIGNPVLWRDELSSWTAADRSLRELFGMLGRVDASNGAYYVVLHLWMLVAGHSPIALRVPSALAMAGAAAFTALVARRMFHSPLAGFAAGLLLVLVPTIPRYAQEARSYAIVTCAMAASVWFLLRALDRPSAARWACYSAAMAVAGVFHLVSLIGVVGQLPLVLLHGAPRRVRWQYPLAAGAAVVPALPVALLGREQGQRQLSWVPQPDFQDLRLFWQILFNWDHVLYAFLVLAALTLLWPGRRMAALRLLLLAGLPVLAVWGLSRYGSSSYFLVRYVLFTLPAWAALAGGGVGAVHAALRRYAPRLPAPLAAACALALLVLPATPALPKVRSDYGVAAHTETDFPGAARLVAADYRPGDALVAVGGNEAWAMVGPGVTYYLPDGVRPPQPFVERTAAQADDLFAVESSAPGQAIGDASRVWVVTIGTGDDPYEMLPAGEAGALRGVFTPAEVRHVRGLTVALLIRGHR